MQNTQFTILNKDQLDTFICKNWDHINQYLDQKKSTLPIPFYSSVDIRESKTKYAPVDHNMYPAGFNNVCAVDLKAALPVIHNAIKKINPTANIVGIIPESHTKNLFYLDHLATLYRLMQSAQFTPYIITFDPALTQDEPIQLTSQDGSSITMYCGIIQNHKTYIKVNNELCPIDTLVMNHDQSNPLPVDWKTVQTPVSPTPLIGWFQRQKNNHFHHYKILIDEFCQHFSINPDLLQAKFRAVNDVDFETKEGLDSLADSIDELLKELPEGSKVFAKASQGTYGMGISVVSSGEEIRQMNRKTRNKMDVGKNSIKFTSVLVQEGVETILKYDDAPAEITIYLIDGECIGGFMRTNTEKDSLSNLNSRGMIFRKLCMTDIHQGDDHKCKEAIYSIMARLSTMAAAKEILEVL